MEARPNDETVAELLPMVRGMLDDERTRGQGLDGKSATLAGFTGTILALTATLGAELLDLDLGDVGSAVFQCLYVISVVALGVASLVALLGVLRPQPRLALAMDEIRRFSQFPLIAQPPVEVQGTMMNTLIEAIRANANRDGTLAPLRGGLEMAVFDYTETSGERGCPRRTRVTVQLEDSSTLRFEERRRGGRPVASGTLRRG
jgi:hypothetical protein